MVQILIGSYTHKEKSGIYQFDFDEQKGIVSAITRYDELENPSYILVDRSLKSIYAVSETNGGGIAQYSFDHRMRMQYENMQLSQGDDPCHLTRHHQDLIVCNYSSGNLSIHSVDENGQISTSKQTIQHIGHGIHPLRQAGPHVHFVASTPNDKIIAVVDLGIDAIIFYKKQEAQYVEHSRLLCDPGAGPRHLGFHPVLKLMYIVNELSSTVSVYQYSTDFRQFARIQNLSTVPAILTENNQCGAIVISQDHRNLYITNRGHDSIANYIIGQDGQLTLKEIICTQGSWPRDCALSPSQDYLFVANEQSDSVSIFKRDAVQGTLSYNAAITVSEPTCIVFIETNAV